MTEDWRKALDNKQVVGVVFIDQFKKPFDSVSHPLLLQKLQGLGIAGDIWLWIKNYLNERKITTIVNGTISSSCKVSYGVPQGSVLGLILFSLFCNHLPDIIQDEQGKLEMYADDTTVNVVGPTPDNIVNTLNRILQNLTNWCTENLPTPHQGKTE